MELDNLLGPELLDARGAHAQLGCEHFLGVLPQLRSRPSRLKSSQIKREGRGQGDLRLSAGIVVGRQMCHFLHLLI